jgi:hypothetical protein
MRTCVADSARRRTAACCLATCGNAPQWPLRTFSVALVLAPQSPLNRCSWRPGVMTTASSSAPSAGTVRELVTVPSTSSRVTAVSSSPRTTPALPLDPATHRQHRQTKQDRAEDAQNNAEPRPWRVSSAGGRRRRRRCAGGVAEL